MFTREKLEYQAIDVPDRFGVEAGNQLARKLRFAFNVTELWRTEKNCWEYSLL